jgi:hypothetical protein
MNKLTVASAASLLLAALATGSPVRAYCDEDCAYERQEAAYERAYERAHGYDEDEGEGYSRPSGGGAQRRARKAPQAERPAELKSAAGARSQSKARVTEDEQSAEPAPAKRSSARSRSGSVMSENSSIVVRSRELGREFAEDDTETRRPSTRAVGCKTYFPSVGMTLSVRCD